jgi:hypothetical protein
MPGSRNEGRDRRHCTETSPRGKCWGGGLNRTQPHCITPPRQQHANPAIPTRPLPWWFTEPAQPEGTEEMSEVGFQAYALDGPEADSGKTSQLAPLLPAFRVAELAGGAFRHLMASPVTCRRLPTAGLGTWQVPDPGSRMSAVAATRFDSVARGPIVSGSCAKK